jgi:hypothetical protein
MLQNRTLNHHHAGRFTALTRVLIVLAAFSTAVHAQTTVSTGTILGTVTDPSGAVVPAAKVRITEKATGRVIDTTTSSTGSYTSGALIPGEYVVRVEAKGFRTTDLPLTVQVSATAPGNVKLQVGESSQVVEVQGSAVQVNTEQATVQGVVTTQQIEQLPFSRNFLDLAQLEPGIQIQDGQTFDPTKNGFSSISIGGRAGRNVRIEVDGVDISDENVGTTTQNIAMGSIQEFQIGQSSLDLSSELTSSGTVNVVTKSGTNSIHGDAFGSFRDKRAGTANFPGASDIPYQRNVFGGSVGGLIIKDRLFFFLAAERTKQDFFSPVVFNAPFDGLSGGYTSPFRENEFSGKLDYQFKGSARLFGKVTYDESKAVNVSGGSNYQPFKSHNSTPSYLGGLDFNTGRLTHSIRFSYSHFFNYIADAVSGTSIYNPAPAINLTFGGGSGFGSGINFIAPQTTILTGKGLKYDGTKSWHSHIFRYGVGLNFIQGYASADFYGSAPVVTSDTSGTSTAFVVANCGNTPTCLGNPLNYPVTSITIGNPFGCFTEIPAFGRPCGGLHDHRFQAYAGDYWKVRPNFTLSLGLRYVRDTGRSDSDLAPIPCSATTLITCSGNLLDQFGNIPGLGNRIRQPNSNFGPQLGIAWDPFKNGKSVVRAGIGLYYDNTVFNNFFFDRGIRLPKGEFNGQAADPCSSGGVLIMPNGSPLTTIDGLNIGTQICGNAIGAVQAAIGDLQKTYQTAALALGPNSPNPFFLGNLLDGFGSLFAPNYQSPRSVQMNIGFQREIRPGTVLSVDFLRNVNTHYLLGRDTNKVGDAKYLNLAAAKGAISTTTSGFNCAGGYSVAAVNCAIAAGATMDDFANNGLDSAGAYLGGLGAPVFGLTPDTGAAFGGINPLVGRNVMYFPAGRSVYDGLQMSLRSQVHNVAPGIHGLNLQVSYALSRFESNTPTTGAQIGDQDFLAVASDFNNPSRYFGPSGSDRTHQVSFGAIFDLAKAGRVSFIGHFDSPLPLTVYIPNVAGEPGNIFRTDFNGDGYFGSESVAGSSPFGDILPGTNIGSFGRSVSTSGLTSVINNYNANFSGHVTPAGQALVSAGLMTQAQLISLGAVMPTIQTPPPGNVGLGWLKTFDITYAYPIRIKERFSVEPSISAFNLFNFANFDSSNNKLGAILDGAPGDANGTTAENRFSTRTGVGSGVFTLGGPRQMEFSLKVTF